MNESAGLRCLACVKQTMIRGLIGVIHLPPMPGDPKAGADTSFAQVVDHALRDVDALVAGGVHGIIVENFGSAPFQKEMPRAAYLPIRWPSWRALWEHALRMRAYR